MLPVVMQESMTDSSQWNGSLEFVIRHEFYHKLTSDVDENSTKQSPRFLQGMLSRFLRGIDWFDYWALGQKLGIKLFDNQIETELGLVIKPFDNQVIRDI